MPLAPVLTVDVRTHLNDFGGMSTSGASAVAGERGVLDKTGPWCVLAKLQHGLPEQSVTGPLHCSGTEAEWKGIHGLGLGSRPP